MKRGRYKKAEQGLIYRINHQIKVPEVRLIGTDGKQIGVVSVAEALKQANEAELDLVEIAPLAKPPVTKIVDYKKFQYQEAKKLSKQKKTSKKGELKEIRLTPFIADGDYQVRIKRIKEFIKDGNQVRMSVFFRGRELAYKNRGYELIYRVLKDLGETVKLDQEPKFIGRNTIATVSPNKK